MTEKTQQSDASAHNEARSSSPDVNKLKDCKKEKCRPMTKVVVRRLPPTMTQEQFLEQVSPLPENDYLYFVKADMSMGQYAYSRAYINFLNQQDIFIFREKFDNYVFVDGKGTEYSAVVEFAPFQRLPKKRIGKKKDMKCGTIESDPYYISFLESLKNQEVDSNNAQPKTEYSYQPSDNASKKITTTPLLEYVKLRRQEKQRLRDEKREERRRRDMEKRRTKEDPIVSKVLKNPDLDKDMSKDNKENKEEKDKHLTKDLKNRNKRDDKLREKMQRDRDSKAVTKGYRDKIEDRTKDREVKYQRRQDDKKLYNKRDDKEMGKDDRKAELKDDRKFDHKDDSRDVKERKTEEKRGKSYEKMRQEKKRLTETKKQFTEVSNIEGNSIKVKKADMDDVSVKEVAILPLESKEILKDEKNVGVKDESFNNDETKVGKHDEKSDLDNSEGEKSRSNECIDKGVDRDNNDVEDKKIVKRRSSLESGGEGGSGDSNCLRRHKSLDGGEQSNLKKSESEEKEKNKKDPRLERRIRNKDRPAMEIYRPGMGKFSKQRLEREKSTNDDRASLSQSPTPTASTSTPPKSGKPGTEVRTMMFKRSVSRDVA